MKFHKLLYVISLLILLGGITLMTNAQRRNNNQDRWQYLGQSNVDGARDHDNIRVNSREAFRAIQLRVQGGEIEFQRVVVHFENGADTEVEIRDRIRAGGQTRAIDLPGDNRRIESVEIWYSRGNWGRRRPSLRLYGLVSTGAFGRDRDRPVQTVYCESGDMKRHWCSEGIGRTVRLIRQRSEVRCVQGRTWGVDRSGIWVDRGCRADFEVR
ncbi:MAG: DUF3011 domain-containing protein [Acidobacteriota bacterium]